MDRKQVIEWLRENTTREQWVDSDTLFFLGVDRELSEGWRTSPCDSVEGVYVQGHSTNKDAEPIYYSDVFPQPVFINGAEYILHFKDEPPRHAWYKSSVNEFHENMNSYPASDFGKSFTVELVTILPPPAVPAPTDINALGFYFGIPSHNVDEIAKAALSRLIEQEVIVGRVGALNVVCQKYNIGDWGDSVIDSVIDYIKLHESQGGDVSAPVSKHLFDRVKDALGDRDVPIAGEDHLVGQVRVDHMKARILDKIVAEFNIPVGAKIIKWLRNRTNDELDGFIIGLKHLLELEPDSTLTELFSAVEQLVVKDVNEPRNKYDREILPGVYVDVYDVLNAFPTNSPALDHAIKKQLAPGERGVKDRVTDLEEAIASIRREIEHIKTWSETK